MDSESILYRTLFLFAGAFVAALLTLAGLIWWTSRKGSDQEEQQLPSSKLKSQKRETVRTMGRAVPTGWLLRLTSGCADAFPLGFGIGTWELSYLPSVLNSLINDRSPSPDASDRAIVRSTFEFTVPRRTTWPRSTMMWIGGFDIAA